VEIKFSDYKTITDTAEEWKISRRIVIKYCEAERLPLIEEYGVIVLPADDEAQALADIYVGEGVIPAKYRYDGLHIAVVTINDLEYVFSLNFKHINKVKTKTMTVTERTRRSNEQGQRLAEQYGFKIGRPASAVRDTVGNK
jgi:adenine-specific DNA methylase